MGKCDMCEEENVEVAWTSIPLNWPYKRGRSHLLNGNICLVCILKAIEDFTNEAKICRIWASDLKNLLEKMYI